jgi:hypothetical protein
VTFAGHVSRYIQLMLVYFAFGVVIPDCVSFHVRSAGSKT